MANFPPLKNYIFYCLDKIIDSYRLSEPFLDIGCGIGDISQHLALRGWRGKAIDFSDVAIEKAKNNLKGFTCVEVEKRTVFQETGIFKTVFLMDVLEHIEDDRATLEKIYNLLSKGGHLIISVPSNPKEWRWDDDLYGHYRRYGFQEIKKKLSAAGFKPLLLWDFTYPFFWIMRRLYTRLKRFGAKGRKGDKLARSSVSSSVNAWEVPFLSDFLSQRFILWDLIYKIQFKYFKDKVQNGHEMIILAEKFA